MTCLLGKKLTANTYTSIYYSYWFQMTWTGASFNPCIAFGPAVITGDFKYYWVSYFQDIYKTMNLWLQLTTFVKNREAFY